LTTRLKYVRAGLKNRAGIYLNLTKSLVLAALCCLSLMALRNKEFLPCKKGTSGKHSSTYLENPRSQENILEKQS
jgi:hypothetical protein